MKTRPRVFFFSLFLFLLSGLFVGLGLVNGWFGETREGIMLFCERARDGLIKQPANTWSNLAFGFVGLYIAWFVAKNKFKGQNLMARNSLFPNVYASSLILTGAGSFAMHASNARLGGFFDLFGMFLIAAFLFCYSIKRKFKISKVFFLTLYLCLVAFCSYVYLSPFNDTGFMLTSAEICFVSLLVSGMLIELNLIFFSKINIQSYWGWAAIITLVISFVIWNLSRTQESIWCNPDSLIQGHALWHILDAFAGLLTFQYYASEIEGN